MWRVENGLRRRVGMHRRHEAALDSERVMDDLGQRGNAVRRARGVRDNSMARRVVGIVVDNLERASRRRRWQRPRPRPFCAGIEVRLCLVALPRSVPSPRRPHRHQARAREGPQGWEPRRLACGAHRRRSCPNRPQSPRGSGQGSNRTGADAPSSSDRRDRSGATISKPALTVERSSQEVPPNPPKAVDGDPGRHSAPAVDPMLASTPLLSRNMILSS